MDVRWSVFFTHFAIFLPCFFHSTATFKQQGNRAALKRPFLPNLHPLGCPEKLHMYQDRGVLQLPRIQQILEYTHISGCLVIFPIVHELLLIMKLYQKLKKLDFYAICKH